MGISTLVFIFRAFNGWVLFSQTSRDCGLFIFMVTGGACLWFGDHALNPTDSTKSLDVNYGNGYVSISFTLVANNFYPFRVQQAGDSLPNDISFAFTPPGGSRTFNGIGHYFFDTSLFTFSPTKCPTSQPTLQPYR